MRVGGGLGERKLSRNEPPSKVAAPVAGPPKLTFPIPGSMEGVKREAQRLPAGMLPIFLEGL